MKAGDTNKFQGTKDTAPPKAHENTYSSLSAAGCGRNFQNEKRKEPRTGFISVSTRESSRQRFTTSRKRALDDFIRFEEEMAPVVSYEEQFAMLQIERPAYSEDAVSSVNSRPKKLKKRARANETRSFPQSSPHISVEGCRGSVTYTCRFDSLDNTSEKVKSSGKSMLDSWKELGHGVINDAYVRGKDLAEGLGREFDPNVFATAETPNRSKLVLEPPLIALLS